MLERELAKLAGENWQVSVEILGRRSCLTEVISLLWIFP